MWRRGGVAAVLVALVAGLGAMSAGAGGSTSPEVAIFFYPWYGTPARDGQWQHWDQRGARPPTQLATRFYPVRGPYSSTDGRVLREQMREIAGMGVDTVVVSWWGPGSVEDGRLEQVAAAARVAGLGVAIHVEPWIGRTPETVRAAVLSLWGRGYRDFYVYDSTVFADVDWARALDGLPPDIRMFANTWLPTRAARGGFQGLYPYDVIVYRSSSFRRVCASAHRIGLVCAPSVGPGFDATRASSMTSVADRRQGGRYDHMWTDVVKAEADVVSVTSYNEWLEGTQIEPARAAKGYASYEGAWGQTGVAAQRSYLDRTRYWIERIRAQ